MWRKFLPERHEAVPPHYGMWLTCFKITRALHKPIFETHVRFRLLVIGLLVSHQYDVLIIEAAEIIDAVWTILLTSNNLDETKILKLIEHVPNKQLLKNASHPMILDVCCKFKRVTCRLGNGNNYFAIPL